MSHMKFMNSIVGQPIYVIRQELAKGLRLKENVHSVDSMGDDTPPFVFSLEEEELHVHGETLYANRVYVLAQDSKEYHETGYIASYEIDNCMMCKKSFGLLLHKHHCRCCGIVICQNCRPFKVIIYEIEQYGPQRVCSLCYYGQDPVYCTRTLRVPFAAPPQPPSRGSLIMLANESNSAHSAPQQTRNLSLKSVAMTAVMAQRQSFSDVVPRVNSNTGSTAIDIPVSKERNSSLLVRSPSITSGNGMPQRSLSISSQGGDNTRLSIHDQNNSSIANSSIINSGSSNIHPNNSNTSSNNSNNISNMNNSLGHDNTNDSRRNSIPNAANGGMAPSTRDIERISNKMEFKLVTPTPGLVIKTKKLGRVSNNTIAHNKPAENKIHDIADDAKIFINFATDSSVPFSPEDGIDTSKLVSMVCGPFRVTVDKKGETSGVVDVIVHPDELQTTYLDTTGVARTRLFDQALVLLQTMNNVAIDSSLKVLTVNGNYKSSDDEGGVAKIAVPTSTADFYYKKQIFTFPTDISKSTLAPLPPAKLPISVTTAPIAVSNANKRSSSVTVPNVNSLINSQPNFSDSTATKAEPIRKPSLRPNIFGMGDKGKNVEQKKQASFEKEVFIESPIALCVVKSKKANESEDGGMKVFINIYYHDDIPMIFSNEGDNSNENTVFPGMLDGSVGLGIPNVNEGALFSAKTPLAVYSDGLNEIYDKNGAIIAISNVVISTNAINSIENLNVDDPATEKLITHLISVLNFYLNDPIDIDSFSLPKIKSNYKGDPLESFKILLPNTGALDANLELFVLPLSDQIASSFARTNAADYNEDSVAAGGGSSVLNKSKSKLTDISLYNSVPLDAGLIKPSSGLVVQAMINNGVFIYVNICHAEGCVEAMIPHLIDYGDSSMLMKSVLLGKIDLNASYRGTSKITTVDIVIPTHLYNQLRPNNPAGVILNLSRPQTPMEHFFDTLKNFFKDELMLDIVGTCTLLRDEYVGNNFIDGELYPIMNISIVDDAYTVVIKGLFSKKGSGAVNSWKNRLVEASQGQLRYYESSTKEYRGQFELNRQVDISIVDDNMTIGAPEGTFSLCFRSKDETTNKFDDFYICCSTEVDRKLWGSIISAYSLYCRNLSFLTKYPDITVGWLGKQGGLIKTWHKRYVVLERGVLTYYDKDPYGTVYNKAGGKTSSIRVVDNNLSRLMSAVNNQKIQSGATSDSSLKVLNPSNVHAKSGDKKGHLLLKGARVAFDNKSKEFKIFNSISDFGNKRDMPFDGESSEDIANWVASINMHIEWANRNT